MLFQILLQPQIEELVIYHVGIILLGDEILLQQSFQGGIYRAWRREMIFLCEGSALYASGFALCRDGDEDIALLFRHLAQKGLVGV